MHIVLTKTEKTLWVIVIQVQSFHRIKNKKCLLFWVQKACFFGRNI
jgi:hypothetical protein